MRFTEQFPPKFSVYDVAVLGNLTTGTIELVVGSEVTVSGCATIRSGASLVLNFSRAAQDGEEVPVLSASCLNGNFSAVQVRKEYLGAECDDVTGQQRTTDTSISVLVTVASNCDGESEQTAVYIVIGVSIGAVLLLMAAVLVLFYLKKTHRLGSMRYVFWSPAKSRMTHNQEYL